MLPDPTPAVRVFTREQLYQLVWSRPVATIAAELGKSGPVLYGFCRRNDVPTPPQGWWTREKHGVAQMPTPLPPRADAALIVIATGPGRPSPKARTAAKVARTAARPDPYPGYPHPVVSRLIAGFRRSPRDRTGFINKQGTYPGRRVPWLKVSRSSLDRLEAILGTLASKLEPVRGEFAAKHEGVVIGIRGRFVMLKFAEGVTSVPYQPTAADKLRLLEWERERHRIAVGRPYIPQVTDAPDGRLRLELQPVNADGYRRDADGSARRMFSDKGARGIEDMLDEVAAAVVALTAEPPLDPVPDPAMEGAVRPATG